MTKPSKTDTPRIAIPARDGFPHFATIPSRWADNDVYGHINNAIYYFYFDTAVNRYLIDHAGLVIAGSTTVGIVVETGCRYHKSFTYPEDIEAGVRVVKLGSTSVRYEIGLFGTGEASARADGHFIHVYVDRTTMRPVPIPPLTRAALERIMVPSQVNVPRRLCLGERIDCIFPWRDILASLRGVDHRSTTR